MSKQLYEEVMEYILSDECVFKVVYTPLSELTKLENTKGFIECLTLYDVLNKGDTATLCLTKLLLNHSRDTASFDIYIGNCYFVLYHSNGDLRFAFDVPNDLFAKIIKYRMMS